jgi:hypothetical protein
MQRARRITLPKRVLKRTTVTLPVDRIEFLDECAKAVGQDRSGFLSIVLDGFEDEIAAFAKSYVWHITRQAKKARENNNEKAVENVQAPQS